MRWLSLLVLILFPAAVLYPCMSFHLLEPDEGRYAEIPREMLAKGEWVIPLLQGEPYLDKPPLMYWLVMLSYSLFGVHDWAARIIPALSVHGCILLIYLFGRRRLGEKPAFWGALILALAPGFEGMARLLLLDGLLTFLATLALFSAFESVQGGRFRRHWWLISAVACGLGILTKGPVILLLVFLPLWLHRRLTGNNPRIPRRAALIYILLILAISLPWYAAICWRLPEFAGHFIWNHNVMRFLQPFDHIEPIWYYLPILFCCLLPASLLVLPFLRFLISNRPEAADCRPAYLGFLLLAGCWCVLFFSMSGSKLPTYILPAMPPLALALGGYLGTRSWRTSTWVTSTVVFFYAGMVGGNYWALPRYAEYRSPMKNSLQVREYCGDPSVPVVCYPRKVNSVAFYLGRDDFRTFRSKYTPQMLQYLQKQDRAVVLFGHRHSAEQLRNLLPPRMTMKGQVPLGLCDMAIVEKQVRVPQSRDR